MIAIISLLIILVLSLLVTRIATVALTLTGLSQESARFQARSAFTGVGFTTSEAEQVVNHPVRRRILMLLMVMGNAGIVTVMASLILTFVDTGGSVDWADRGMLLLGGLVILMILAKSKWVDRRMSRLINMALKRWTDLDVKDYASLFRLSDGYSVTEMNIEPGDWMAGRSLAELKLTDEGAIVLGIYRSDKSYVGAPRGETAIHAYDRLIIYGQAHLLSELDCRGRGQAGDRAHLEAVHALEALREEQVSAEGE